MKLEERVSRLETAHAAQRSAVGGWSVAQWEAERAAHAGESVDQWLTRMLADDNLERWPADRRASMAALYRSTAELEAMFGEGVLDGLS